MFKNFINGEWLIGAGSRRNINPSDTNDVIGEYAQADAAQATYAIESANWALEMSSFGDIKERSDALDFVGNELLLRKDELGELLSREEGKTLKEGIGEVVRAGQIFKFYAAEALRLKGECGPSVRPGLEVSVTREPLGVVGVITPWNFPIAIPAWKIAPAIAYGNSVVFKPAELVPGSAWSLAEIISRSGLQKGVFNLVMGPGSNVGQTILEDPRVTGVTFTGSTKTGRRVMQTAGARFAKLQLEMGGKNPLVILDDANLELAVDVAVDGGYFSTGQRCTASSRFIVEKGIYNQFIDKVSARLQELKVGHALDPDTDIGPVVDRTQFDQDLSYIKIGLEEGARLVTGGECLQEPTPGFFLTPALFVDCESDMRIVREEIFGPVACVMVAENYEHALELANDTEFGLSSGICTSSLKYATDFQRRSKSGMVMVNAPTAGVDFHVPFGGTKSSSFGSREQGSYACEFYTTVKTSYIKPA